jgi:hypothetical protein
MASELLGQIGLVDGEGLARLEVMVVGAGLAGLRANHVDVSTSD